MRNSSRGSKKIRDHRDLRVWRQGTKAGRALPGSRGFVSRDSTTHWLKSFAGWRTKSRMRSRLARARDNMRPTWITSRGHVGPCATWSGD